METPYAGIAPKFIASQFQFSTHLLWVRKEDSAMAKLHARPSKEYRYEHYDPWGGSIGAL